MVDKEYGCLPYHIPDNVWSVLGINSFQDFIDKKVYKGQFHSNVPEDIVKSYTIVEYLMAHSYYHYNMYDEALTKITQIFEMAIKLKCKELNIDLTNLRNNKKFNKNLHTLIDEICEEEKIKNMNNIFLWLKHIRNLRAHPNRMNIGLGLVSNVYTLFVAIINKLFHKIETWENIMEKHNSLENEIKLHLSGLTIFNHNNNRYLIDKISLLDTVIFNGDWIYLIALFPIYKDFKESLVNNSLDPPFVFYFNDLVIKQDELLANIYNTNCSISVEMNKDEKNMITASEFKSELASLNTLDEPYEYIYENHNISYTNKRLYEFQYQFYHKMT